jgi:hypothetical protein
MQKKSPDKSMLKAAPKPKMTDAERHKRFVDMAHEVEADESQEAFDRAFDKLSVINTMEEDNAELHQRAPETRKSEASRP